MNIGELIELYKNAGYEQIDAVAKAAQDIILLKIFKSSLNRSVTIKGGVVMHNISNDMRRATRDLDLDFIKYSLNDEAIRNFIHQLNNVGDKISIKINGKIERLHHQDYDGKRVNITLIDENGYKINSKLDIGVHKDFDIKQEEYCFQMDAINETVTLLINSKEQIFAEKLKSLLRFGYTSTRYKDIFDFYYLIKCNLDKIKVYNIINKTIIEDKSVKANNIEEIYKLLKSVLNNRRFLSNLDNIKVNWLDVDKEEVIKVILNYLNELQAIAIN